MLLGWLLTSWVFGYEIGSGYTVVATTTLTTCIKSFETLQDVNYIFFSFVLAVFVVGVCYLLPVVLLDFSVCQAELIVLPVVLPPLWWRGPVECLFSTMCLFCVFVLLLSLGSEAVLLQEGACVPLPQFQ